MVNNEYLKVPPDYDKEKSIKPKNTHSHNKNTFSLAELEGVFCYNSVRPHHKGWHQKRNKKWTKTEYLQKNRKNKIDAEMKEILPLIEQSVEILKGEEKTEGKVMIFGLLSLSLDIGYREILRVIKKKGE